MPSAIAVIWEFGTGQRIIGPTHEGEHFLVSLPAADGDFGATYYEYRQLEDSFSMILSTYVYLLISSLAK